MKNRNGIFAGISFALLSFMPFLSLGITYGKNPLKMLKNETEMCIDITVFTVIAFYIGYKYAERIFSNQNKFEQFKIGCIMAIRIAIFSALSLVPIALLNAIINGTGKLSIEFALYTLFYFPAVYLLGCFMFSWLILPIAGVGCILINFIHKNLEHE